MKTYRTILLATILLAVAAGAWAQTDGETIAVPLTDPSRAVELKISILNGGLSVIGYDGSEILVEARERPGEERKEHADGMMRIPNTGFGLTINERDNRVTVSADWSQRPLDLLVRVPRKTSVRLNTVNNGDLELEGVDGAHELSNTNGAIRARGISGSVVAATTNGPVEVDFERIAADQPMSFTTWNGDVKVSLPAGLKADLKLESGRGDVYTDFDVALKPVATRVERERGENGFRVRLERAVEGTIGGGGPEFHFKTFNGSIYLRKAG